MTVRSGEMILLTRADAISEILEMVARHHRAGFLTGVDLHVEPGRASGHWEYAPGAPAIVLHELPSAPELDEEWDRSGPTPADSPRSRRGR